MGDPVINGINIGVVPITKSMGPINVGLLGMYADNLNGISISGLLAGANNINGLGISPGMTVVECPINGIAIGGALAGAGSVNGITLGGLFANSTKGDINGVVSSLGYILVKKKLRGLSITPGYMKSNRLMGVSIAGYAKINQSYGLSVALYNRAAELHGVQLGLLNYAGNNRKGLRMLPLINLHF